VRGFGIKLKAPCERRWERGTSGSAWERELQFGIGCVFFLKTRKHTNLKVGVPKKLSLRPLCSLRETLSFLLKKPYQFESRRSKPSQRDRPTGSRPHEKKKRLRGDLRSLRAHCA
jgi:hypothetical protein